jgi:hypothetical protein
MRPDVFEISKSLHVKLNKDLYIALRVEAFQRGLTMQEMFTLFAKLVVEKNPQIVKFLDAHSVQKIKNKLKKKPDQEEIRSDLDSDSLYELIETAEEKESNEKK